MFRSLLGHDRKLRSFRHGVVKRSRPLALENLEERTVPSGFDKFGVDPFAVGITAGPDGNLWFTNQNANRIGRITPAGHWGLFRVPTPGSSPTEITAGLDGNLWFTEQDGNKIGRITAFATVNLSGGITPAGTVTEFPIPDFDSLPYGITAGPDSNLWFTQQDGNIGRITPAGNFAEFPVPVDAHNSLSDPLEITAGPDGSIWFTEIVLHAPPLGNEGSIDRLILPSHFGVSPSINPVPAGVAFDVTVRGLDPSNRLAENYRGSVHFTSSDGGATLPGDYTFTAADNGAHTFSVTLRAAGRQSITVTDTVQSKLTGTPMIDVTGAAADHLSLSAPATAASGQVFAVTVTIQDAFNNTVTNYSGTVTFASSDVDPGVVLPADYTFVAGDAGVHTFTDTGLGETTLITPGDQTITTTDTGSGITGIATVAVVGGQPPGGSGSHGGALFAFAVDFVPAVPVTATRITARPAQEVPRAMTPVLEVASVERLFAAAAEQDLGFASSRSKQQALLSAGDWWVDELGKGGVLVDRLFPATHSE